jgi:hypothetical protein
MIEWQWIFPALLFVVLVVLVSGKWQDKTCRYRD